MGILVYSLLWVMQDFVHQPYYVLSSDIRSWAESSGDGFGACSTTMRGNACKQGQECAATANSTDNSK